MNNEILIFDQEKEDGLVEIVEIELEEIKKKIITKEYFLPKSSDDLSLESIPLQLPIDEKLQEINLLGDPYKKIQLAKTFDIELIPMIQQLFKEFHDIFSYSYDELLCVLPTLCQHRIRLFPQAVPAHAKPYRMNPIYSEKAHIELKKLIHAKFIYEFKKQIGVFLCW